ncbi:hypothetical protein [Halobacillus yeomjeoni]|uniref:Uncharacterized protein n=1 Tax=Halobacillus yeomjeoni TaxID=311194 RepID=A0A931HRZ5_9BACI|nr:hypothetical protein [Halobacillus yeomjeoni]MBH0228827.1 hypothetical protein [Halobacillus yeomjeoni]
MFLGILLLGIAMLLAYIEIKSIPKRKEQNKALKIITKKLKIGNQIREPVVLASGSTGVSLYDIYAAADNHEEVLKVLEQRFPNAVSDYNSIEWYNKINLLYKDGSVDSYISAYAGQKAENLSLEYFRDKGLHAELFKDRNHPNDDIRVYQEDGSYVDYSVKSLNSTSSFQQEVITHPESTHYVVNKELYNDLSQKGLLQSYEDNGITIVNGNYSNEELRDEGMLAFESLKASGEVFDNIPLIAAALFGVKTYKNINYFRQGSQSPNEFRINLISDTFRLGTAGLSAMAGAKGGALIGTTISPGIGTVIGGGVGALISAYSGTKLINWVTVKVKWAHILKAQYHYGKMNYYKMRDEVSLTLANKIFGFSELNKELTKEEELFKKYEDEFNPFINETPLSIPAILSYLHIQKLNKRINQMRVALDMTRKDLIDLSNATAEKLVNNISVKQNILKTQLFGEFFLSNESLKSLTLDKETDELVNKYHLQKEKNPNYPTKYPFEIKEIIEELAITNFRKLESDEVTNNSVHNKLVWIICLILTVFSLALISSTLKYLILIFVTGLCVYLFIKIVLNFVG